ncbi:TetR/AcrR family transcriptional regulator [Amycolatopsis albispora]|uniref:TetR family transcriptional regulator n=1 Tax=Amycolatopsis albispora TaxID=1804986 RepID=A0A344L7N2_9PSEU|nr:TetR family transcriptional regulator [Amycolatopsis albispora]AXB44056.1 TetR family transcriptional regulator [Amycolatopsis albispora]
MATTKRRGRRPAGEDTRAAMLAAAREMFAELGYEGATVRAIAERAGVDAAMVNHWFGGKQGLFAQAVLQLPFDPVQLFTHIFESGPVEELGERIVRTFLTRWDESGGGAFAALIRSVAGHEQVAAALRHLFLEQMFTKLAERVSSDQLQFRASLCASQVVGMGMVRYVAKFEPLASAEREEVVAAVAPTLQRYLTGDLDPAG